MKSVLNSHKKDWCWSWNFNTLATWCKELTHWKRPWCWERLKAGREGDNRVRDDWMASTIWWTWVWVSSRSWRWTGKLGVLQSMGSQRVRQTEQLNWTELSCCCTLKYKQTAKDHWASEESSQYDKDPNNQKKQHRGNREHRPNEISKKVEHRTLSKKVEQCQVFLGI